MDRAPDPATTNEPEIARAVQVTSVAFGTAALAWLVAVVLLPVTPPAHLVWVAAAVVASTAVTVRSDLEVALSSRRGRWLVEAHVAVVVLATTAVAAVAPAVAAAPLVLALLVAGFVARARVVALLAAVAATGLATADLTGATTWPTALAIVAAGAIAGWLGRFVRSRHAELVRAHVTARERAEQQARALTAVAGAARDIHVLEATAVLDAVADVATELGWDRCAVYVPAVTGEGLVVASGRGMDVLTVQEPRPNGVLATVLDQHRTVVRSPYTEHPDHNPKHGDLGAAVGVPVASGEGAIGALVVGRDRVGVDDADVHLVELLAGQAGRAVETARAFDAQLVAMEEVERTAQLKEDFVATVSHELRTPLHVVQGMAETLHARWDDLDPDLRLDLAARLREHAGDLSGLVETLLDFTRLQTGDLELPTQEVDVGAVVTEVVARAAAAHPDHVLACRTPDAAVDVLGDGALLERTIDNLVTNACVHTPPATHVTAEVTTTDTTVRVEVRDDGPGIDPVDLPRIGERFYRGGRTHLRRETRGVGIGLAFCMDVLHLHDSALQVQSRLGEGASFAFTLPRASAGQGPARPPGSTQTSASRP